MARASAARSRLHLACQADIARNRVLRGARGAFVPGLCSNTKNWISAFVPGLCSNHSKMRVWANTDNPTITMGVKRRISWKIYIYQ